MSPTMGKTAILKKYFGLHPNQTLAQFGNECKELRESDPQGYDWTVNAAAQELNVEVKSA